MKSERFWVLLLALTTFCAGLAAGELLSLRRHPVQDASPFGSYEARMIDAFDLDEERVSNLRYILRDYQEKIDALKDSNIAALDPDLVKIGLRHRDLIRTYVVPEHHRQEFDLWVGGLPVISSETKPE